MVPDGEASPVGTGLMPTRRAGMRVSTRLFTLTQVATARGIDAPVLSILWAPKPAIIVRNGAEDRTMMQKAFRAGAVILAMVVSAPVGAQSGWTPTQLRPSEPVYGPVDRPQYGVRTPPGLTGAPVRSPRQASYPPLDYSPEEQGGMARGGGSGKAPMLSSPSREPRSVREDYRSWTHGGNSEFGGRAGSGFGAGSSGWTSPRSRAADRRETTRYPDRWAQGYEPPPPDYGDRSGRGGWEVTSPYGDPVPGYGPQTSQDSYSTERPQPLYTDPAYGAPRYPEAADYGRSAEYGAYPGTSAAPVYPRDDRPGSYESGYPAARSWSSPPEQYAPPAASWQWPAPATQGGYPPPPVYGAPPVAVPPPYEPPRRRRGWMPFDWFGW